MHRAKQAEINLEALRKVSSNLDEESAPVNYSYLLRILFILKANSQISPHRVTRT